MVQDTPHFLDGGGHSAAEIRAFDWASTPLGAMDGWPVSLKTAVGMMVASQFPKAIFWGPDYTMLHNDAFRIIMGAKPAAIGRSMRDVWAEVWDEIRPIAERAMKGHATYIEDFPLTIIRSDLPEECFFTFCYSPIRDEAGHIAGFIDTVIENTGKVRAETALQTQNAELSHRIQNTLAIISSIARQTLREAESTSDAWQVLQFRLAALAETHNLLRSGARSGADIHQIVQATLRPHESDFTRFDIAGPDIMIPERQALALSLAVNELATNSIKHGALSSDRGRVAITWTITATTLHRELRFSWRESGGPTVQPPTRRGFGTRLIEEVVPADFGGEAVLQFHPEGVTYDLTGSMTVIAPQT